MIRTKRHSIIALLFAMIIITTFTIVGMGFTAWEKPTSVNSVIGDTASTDIVSSGTTSGYTANCDSIEVAIIMYHNIVPNKYKPNKYEISLAALESDFNYIKKSGYYCVSPRELMEYAANPDFDLPKQCVMLTFDDGFYNYNMYLDELLSKYNMNSVVSVVGAFTKYNKSTSATSRYIYMDYDDIRSLGNSPRVEIAAHSYELHYIRNNRTGVRIKPGESMEQYRTVFNNDCQSLENNLAKVGVSVNCYTYPYGAYCLESEAIIKERGYRMSLTCEERVNKITRNKDCLYRLGRYNRHGVDGSAEKILSGSLKHSSK